MDNFRKAIALYCISSLHPHTKYIWEVIGESGSKEFPSTPVIFIGRSGLYQCTLIHNAKRLFGKIITVRVDIGNFITIFIQIIIVMLLCLYIDEPYRTRDNALSSSEYSAEYSEGTEHYHHLLPKPWHFSSMDPCDGFVALSL